MERNWAGPKQLKSEEKVKRDQLKRKSDKKTRKGPMLGGIVVKKKKKTEKSEKRPGRGQRWVD